MGYLVAKKCLYSSLSKEKKKVKTKPGFEKTISFYTMFIGDAVLEPVRPLKV